MNRFSTACLASFVLLAAGGCGNPTVVEVDEMAKGSERLVRLHFDNFTKSKSGAT